MIRKDGKFSYEFEKLEDAVEAALRAEAEVVEIKLIRSWPPLLSKEQRDLVESKIDLKEYANMSLCGDGLDIDFAQHEISSMPDEELLEKAFFFSVTDSEETWEDLRELLGPEEGDRVHDAMERHEARSENHPDIYDPRD